MAKRLHRYRFAAMAAAMLLAPAAFADSWQSLSPSERQVLAPYQKN